MQTLVDTLRTQVSRVVHLLLYLFVVEFYFFYEKLYKNNSILFLAGTDLPYLKSRYGDNHQFYQFLFQYNIFKIFNSKFTVIILKTLLNVWRVSLMHLKVKRVSWNLLVVFFFEIYGSG
jgi:hypothetical protein